MFSWEAWNSIGFSSSNLQLDFLFLWLLFHWFKINSSPIPSWQKFQKMQQYTRFISWPWVLHLMLYQQIESNRTSGNPISSFISICEKLSRFRIQNKQCCKDVKLSAGKATHNMVFLLITFNDHLEYLSPQIYINTNKTKKYHLPYFLLYLIFVVLWTDMTQKYADIDFHWHLNFSHCILVALNINFIDCNSCILNCVINSIVDGTFTPLHWPIDRIDTHWKWFPCNIQNLILNLFKTGWNKVDNILVLLFIFPWEKNNFGQWWGFELLSLTSDNLQ